jgi:hypothetical protein
LIHEKMEYGRRLFSQLREILRIEVESVPLSTVLETNGDEEVFKMKTDLEDFKKKLSKDILKNKSRIREKKIVIDHLEKYKDKLFLTNFRIDLYRYTPQLCCGWDRPMQQRDIVKQCFGIQHTPILQSASAIMPRSSAAVGCAGATFDFIDVVGFFFQAIHAILSKLYRY